MTGRLKVDSITTELFDGSCGGGDDGGSNSGGSGGGCRNGCIILILPI